MHLIRWWPIALLFIWWPVALLVRSWPVARLVWSWSVSLLVRSWPVALLVMSDAGSWFTWLDDGQIFWASPVGRSVAEMTTPLRGQANWSSLWSKHIKDSKVRLFIMKYKHTICKSSGQSPSSSNKTTIKGLKTMKNEMTYHHCFTIGRRFVFYPPWYVILTGCWRASLWGLLYHSATQRRKLIVFFSFTLYDTREVRLGLPSTASVKGIRHQVWTPCFLTALGSYCDTEYSRRNF